VGERWDRARVLALAPDASSLRAAQPLASGPSWLLTGTADGIAGKAADGAPDEAAGASALWGECVGSAADRDDAIGP